ncbi:TPA: RloB domain-containing protein, partial [Escherichia coli]|nr:RloB domain-containing protein [Escherichia coli]
MNTEPAYFEALGRSVDRALIDIKTEKAVGTPMTIAEVSTAFAKGEGLNRRRRAGLNSFEKGDEVWAVFDRDEHPYFQDAVNLCERHNVNVARSNPCFEVWLILHREEYNRSDNRHQTQRHLSNVCPEYDPGRGKTPDCV